MRLVLNPNSLADYKRFLAIKSLPIYSFRGREAWFPDEYAERLGVDLPRSRSLAYEPSPFLFDYQRDIAGLAIQKRKFALFMDCGLGKTLVYFEFVRHALRAMGGQRGALILSPPMVIDQTRDECFKFFGESMVIERIDSRDAGMWLKSCAGKVGITNFEAMRHEFDAGQLGCLAVDESDIMASHYGKYGLGIVKLGRGLEWKIAGTGTPAPNDRIEYANHAVFLDHYPTVNSFLARFFVNRGQTQERWALKPHALEPFYRALSHWSIFLSNPATYGWKDNCGSIPPIHVHIQEVEMTPQQKAAVQKTTGGLFAANPGGITKRSALSRIAKGLDGIPTRKYEVIRRMVASWPTESTIIWCWFNDEQETLERVFPEAASIQGTTKHERRLELIKDFKAGRRKVLISKPDVLGKGLNLQIATRQIFSSLIDSYRDYYQAIKRSNRIGSTKPLNVHIPVVDCERPMIENVMRKVALVQQDTEQQERIFRAACAGRSLAREAAEAGINLESFCDGA
jgi:superfamily II DNA or RNA helicase